MYCITGINGPFQIQAHTSLILIHVYRVKPVWNDPHWEDHPAWKNYFFLTSRVVGPERFHCNQTSLTVSVFIIEKFGCVVKLQL